MRPGRLATLALLALTVLLLTGAAAVSGQTRESTPEQEATPEPEATPLSIPPEHQASVIVVTVINANIRAEPDTEAEVLATTGVGYDYPLLAQQAVEGELWYQVTTYEGEPGWLHSSTARLVVSWLRVFETFDGVEMALVPAGCFAMGSPAGQGEDDEHPLNVQCFDQPFWIDRYEVSNFDYGSAGYFVGDTRPRDSVNWFDAAAYCAARDARLPTEAEWEYAARGPEALIYPWGNEFVNDNVVSSWQETARRTEPVDSRSAGASWVGAFNLSGNVWEWTASLYAGYPYDRADGREDGQDTVNPRVVRGGSCCSYIIADVRAAYRFPVAPFLQDPNIGFRCARSYQP